jgi:hypothetical protein
MIIRASEIASKRSGSVLLRELMASPIVMNSLSTAERTRRSEEYASRS